MEKELVFREKEILEILQKTSRHYMNTQVCKGCNQSHHYIVCLYDFLMTLDETGKLNENFEVLLAKMGKGKQP
jgi:hypothetical protein